MYKALKIYSFQYNKLALLFIENIRVLLSSIFCPIDLQFAVQP